MSSKNSTQEKKDFDKFTKFFIYKGIQIIVQSRLGEKVKSRSKPFSSGTDWFNLAITDNNDVQTEAKKVLSGQTATLGQTVCIEISLRTADGDTMVLELWYICLDTHHTDKQARMAQTGYYRMGIALKSVLNISRITPAYKLSRRQGSVDYVICYRIYLGDPQFYILGEGYKKSKVGSVPSPFGTISINLSYRTKLLISPQTGVKDVPFEVKDDHFKEDNNIYRPAIPKPCSLGFRRSSTSDFDTTGQSDESCTTTFLNSPSDGNNFRGPLGLVPHYQSQPIKINVHVPAPDVDNFLDKASSAPEKPTGFPDIHRVGAFVQQFTSEKDIDVEEVPFFSLLQQVKNDKTGKPDNAKLDCSKGTASTKTDSSKADTSETALSESKTSTSSQASAPEDFVMVELKTPFGCADVNSDLGQFYRECQTAPTLTLSEEEQTVPETLEKLTSQLDVFETNMKDFDDFLSNMKEEYSDTEGEPAGLGIHINKGPETEIS